MPTAFQEGGEVPVRRTAVVLAALVLDLVAGDPPDRWHPVAWVGRLVAWLTRRAPQTGPRRQLAYGLVVVAAASLAMLGPYRAAERGLRRLPAGRHWPGPWLRGTLGLALEAALLKSTFALRGLLRAGAQVQRDLERGDLEQARQHLPALVSRDTAGLPTELVASAAVESLAENLTDSVVAPLLAYRLFGLPGAALYRAVNTCDAMVGYRGRYEYLGKVAARLDDALNLAPARLSALLLVAAAPLAGGSLRGALRILGRDRDATASPNAGWTMSAAAGALGVQLEKADHYRLGDPIQPVTPATIAQAGRLVGAAVGLAVGLLALWEGRRYAGVSPPR
ncbi:MAG: cobalamin biosynthesis protein CobD [Chloroflexi bacterium]|nr:cobalamin biosynthesis protein CobD [Chloroflexota bacterium]